MKEVSHYMMKPGHLLEYRCPKFGIVFQWRVLGIYPGAVRQEGLVEIEPVLQSPGTDSRGELHERMMVPETMTRRLTIIAPGINPKQETQP